MSDMSALPIHDAGSTPVFDCHVLLSIPAGDGTITARVASLPTITACGTSERDVLMSIVKRFKETVRRHLEKNESVPWSDPPDTRQEGESERWIPVHL